MLGPLARLAGSDGPRPAAVSCAALPSLILFFFFFFLTIAVAAAWTGTKSRPAPAGSVAASLAVTPAAASARPGALPAAPFPAKEELPPCKASLMIGSIIAHRCGQKLKAGTGRVLLSGSLCHARRPPSACPRARGSAFMAACKRFLRFRRSFRMAFLRRAASWASAAAPGASTAPIVMWTAASAAKPSPWKPGTPATHSGRLSGCYSRRTGGKHDQTFHTPLVSHVFPPDNIPRLATASNHHKMHCKKSFPGKSLVHRQQQVRQDQVMTSWSHQVWPQAGWPCKVRLLWQPV